MSNIRRLEPFLPLYDQFQNGHWPLWNLEDFGSELAALAETCLKKKCQKVLVWQLDGGENEYDGGVDGGIMVVMVVMMISLAPQLFTLSVLSSRPFFSLQSLNMMVVMTMRIPVQELFRHISALFMIVGKRWHYINGEAKIMIPVRFTSNENGTKSKTRNRPTFNKEIQQF